MCKAKEDRIALCNEKVSLPPAYRYAGPATVLAGLFLWSAAVGTVARFIPNAEIHEPHDELAMRYRGSNHKINENPHLPPILRERRSPLYLMNNRPSLGL